MGAAGVPILLRKPIGICRTWMKQSIICKGVIMNPVQRIVSFTGYIMLAVGVFILVFCSYRIIEGIAKKDWASTQGTILKRERIYTLLNAKYESRYTLRIDYEYQVDGKTYQGQDCIIPRYTFGESKDGIKRLEGSYKIGGPIKIFFDPLNAGKSSLITDVLQYIGWLLGFGVLFLGLGTLSAIRNRLARPNLPADGKQV